MGLLTARWLKNILKLLFMVCLVFPTVVWFSQTSRELSQVKRHELRSNRRPLTDHVTDHVVMVQTLNGTLNLTDVRVNGPDVNNVNYVNDSEAFPVNIQQPKYIFFNRVPKCGSTGIKAIFRMLARLNNWHMMSSHDFNHERLFEDAQKVLVRSFYNLTHPVVFERHVNFINFTRFGAEMPFYINVVREPLQQLVSDYYFLRFHLADMFPMAKERRAQTYDECVHGNYSECVEDGPRGYYRIIPFFCGQEVYCRKPSSESLHTAMRNVERHYAVVGIAEELPGFMQVLEYIAQRYFKRAHDVFIKNEKKIKEKFKTRKKIPPENNTVAIMTTKLRYDYEFYHFIRRKFYATWNKVKLKLKTS